MHEEMVSWSSEGFYWARRQIGNFGGEKLGKILGSWSGMRKYLEVDMLSDSLQGRVRYNCTRYVGMDECHVFEIYIDGVRVKQFSWETVNKYLIDHGFKENKKPVGIQEYWDEFWSCLKEQPIDSRSEFTDEEFCEALEKYRNQPIQESLISDNPLERMFAVLDRRVGQRTLRKVKECVALQPGWLAAFYRLRLDSDHI